MVNKNDLSALKAEPKNTLANIKKNTIEQAKAWRKPKPISEKQSEKVTLKFTIGEMEIIKEKAWLVPIATYLKAMLKNQTSVFK